MPIKRSAILLMALAASSFILLVISSADVFAQSPLRVTYKEMQGCPKLNTSTTYSTWEMLSHLVIRLAA